MSATITLPKRTREGSIKPAEVEDALATFDSLPEDSREAVVVGRGFESENSARNRARLMGLALKERTDLLYSAHAVPDPDSDGTFIGALTVRANQDPRPRVERDKNAPTLRALQDAARELKVKGRSKMDYNELWDAIEQAGVDPNSYGKA